MLMTVGDLIAELQREDSGAEASFFSKGTSLLVLQLKHGVDEMMRWTRPGLSVSPF